VSIGADPECPLRSLEEATGRPGPVTGTRTSPRGVGLSFREIAEPGSEPLVARSPLDLHARTRRPPGSFPKRLALRSEELRALSWTSAPLQGFRPVAPADPYPDRLLPWGFCPLRRFSIAGPVHPGLPHPAPSDLRVWIPSRRLAPCARYRSEDRTPPLGFTLQGFVPSGQPHPFPGRCPHAVSGSPVLLL
jgi:hypothetical protein